MPAVEDQPPGIGPETAEEGMIPPADHPMAAEDVGVTELEELRGETPAERSRRERPDLPQVAPDDAVGRLAVGATDDDPDDDAEWVADDQGMSAEESAVHVRDLPA